MPRLVERSATSLTKLVEGNKVRCPGCEVLCDPSYHLKPFARAAKYRQELNVVYQHRRDRGGCGHVFSPGEPWIVEEYLAGNLVPRAVADHAAVLAANQHHHKVLHTVNEEDNERRASAA